MGRPAADEPPGWSLAWSDEFNGPAGSPVAPGSWRPEVGGHGWGNEQVQHYTREAREFGDY
jgi:hypothetical protein